jgi:uncharacterized SAM-binding protein YcdF (DUF218 family)
MPLDMPANSRTDRRTAVVVLGKKPPRSADIHADFAANLLAAADLVQRDRSSLLIISGGCTRRGRWPEALAGLHLVRDRVAPPIVLELQARTTAENILNVRPIVEGRGFERVTFVTSQYHIGRTRLLVGRLWPEISTTARYAHGANTNRVSERLINGLYLPVAAVDPGNHSLVRLTRGLFRGGQGPF